jgi:hypothetical protein
MITPMRCKYLRTSIIQQHGERFGCGYGVVTYGNPEHNVTLGLGCGFFDGNLSSDSVKIFSSMTRLSLRISLVSENWFFPTDVYRGIISNGIRFLEKPYPLILYS